MRRLFVTLALFTALAFWLLVSRGSFGVSHQWYLDPNARPWPFGAWLLPLGVIFISGGAAALSVFDRFKRAKSDKEKRNSTLTALFCLSVLLFLWPWALLGPGAISQQDSHGGPPRLTLEGRFNLIATQWSDVATEYFGVAYQVQDARQFGREYAQKWQEPPSQFQAHVATHPPGAVLFFYGLRRIYESAPPLQKVFEGLAVALTGQKLEESRVLAGALRSSTSLGLGAPAPPPLPISAVGGALWSAFALGFSLVLATPAVYGLATAAQSGDEAEKRGLFAVALWVTAPAVNLFAFTLDAPIAAGCIWTLYFVTRALDAAPEAAKSARLWMIGAGITLALTSFLSFGALAVGAFIAIILAWKRREMLLQRGAELLLGFAATWLFLALIFAFNPLEIFFQAMQVHRLATLNKRSYLLWLPMNLVMWAPFAGFSMLICALHRPQNRLAAAQFGAAMLLVLLLLSLSGNVRGEVERLWLFALAPLAVGAAFLPLCTRKRAIFLGLQALQTLLMAATLGPLVRP